MGEQRVKPKSEAEAMAEAEKMLKAIEKKSEKTEEQGTKTEKVVASGAKKVARKKMRSVKYQEAFKLVDRNKQYLLDEALDLVEKTSYAKFDSSLELHIRLKSKKGQENIRGLVQMPHGTGREKKIGIIDEEMIEKIAKEKRTTFDIILASPAMMAKLAKVAKILGPQGKMPNPKSGTVTNDPQKTIEEFKKGKVEYKSDQYGNIHQVVGKISWNNTKLKENIQAFINALPQARLQSITLCATMGPGIKVKV